MKNFKNVLLGMALLLVTDLYALEVKPTYRIFVLKPGERIREELTLTSTEETALNVSAETKDWYVMPANKNIKTGDWLKIDEKPFVLKPGESKVIRFTAGAPKKATGEVMGMLSFFTKNQEGGMLSFRLSVAVYVVIQGTEKKQGEVTAISIVSSTNTVVSYLFNNTGNVHLRPKGLMKVYNENDELVLNMVYDQSLPTYPGRPQAYSGTVKNYRLPEGRYTAHIQLQDADWNFDYPLQKKKFSVTSEGKTKTR